MADVEKHPADASDGAKYPAEKTVGYTTGRQSPSTDSDLPQFGPNGERPAGWKYRQLKVGPVTFPWYASPRVQLFIVSMACFLCPGMFNALNGIGGAGQIDTDTSNIANLCVYSVFAVVGFFAGTITNRIGIKLALSFGGLGYCIYIAAFLCYSNTQNRGFVIFAGCFLGVCAGLLWTAQGSLMMSYPNEASKGKYISWFWMIFNLGAVIGSLIPLGQNIHDSGNHTVTDGTYIGFLVLTIIGACCSWLLCKTKDVIRSDGSRVILIKHPSWKSELTGLWEGFLEEPYIVLLFPMFWSSNWFYTYQFNDVNHARFNTRTSTLNNVLYYIMQIIGAFIAGYLLDIQSVQRSTRARAAWVILFVLTMAIWGGGYDFQKGVTREDADLDINPDFHTYDWTEGGYIGPMFLYMFYGMYDAVWQTCVYWFMGSMSNNSRKLAYYAGWYKGIQSAGAAVMFAMDYHKVTYWAMFGSCWGLLGGSLIIALPLILLKIKDHVPIEEDLKFSDETYAEVAPTVERQASMSAQGAGGQSAKPTAF